MYKRQALETLEKAYAAAGFNAIQVLLPEQTLESGVVHFTVVESRLASIRIEGNTDERGSAEYNLALGQKRAESVGRALALLGAEPQQVEAVSFGEERPAVQGSDEAAWAKNRRAEIKDR